MECKLLNFDLTMDVLTVPTVSNHEVMMVDYLKRWADDNQVLNWMDKAGNLYFVKGDKPMKGGFPCLSAHLDTVQTGQLPYIERGQRLPYSIEEQRDGTHKIFTEGMGIGADCKCGIAICLHLIRTMDHVKAVFFHNEEKSMEGAANADWHFFADVSYFFDFDGMGLDLEWHCGGRQFFTYGFYEKYLKDIVEKHHMRVCSQLFADAYAVCFYTHIATVNFGNGSHNIHSDKEYFIAEEMDEMIEIAETAINRLGTQRYHCEFSFGDKMRDYSLIHMLHEENIHNGKS